MKTVVRMVSSVEETPPLTHCAGDFLVWTLAFSLHAAGLYAVWMFHANGQPQTAAMALGLYVGSGLTFVLPGLLFQRWYASRSTVYGLTAALTLSLPCVGLVGCLLAPLCARLLMHQKNKTIEFKQSLHTPDDDSGWIPRKRVGQFLVDEIAIEPVVDVLQGNDPDLKRGAVKLLQRIGTPGAVGLLRKCLSDEFPEVRFYAHSALTDIEDTYTKRIQELNAAFEAAPSASVDRQIGLLYRAYADSGLADEITRAQHLESCRVALLRSLEREPEHAQAMLLLGQVLLDLNRSGEAWKVFGKCLRHEETASEAHLGLVQIAYQERDFAQLAVQARNMEASSAPRPQKADQLALFEFWSNASRGANG